jgi:response regulator RpfG family c-di-GMP phosphodiesterase
MKGSDNKLSGCRVLIVEDEHLLAMDLEDTLKTQGARIIGPYGNLDAAYRRAERDHFDVGIIDINLRDEAAYPVADELMRQRIPFCFCTGYEASVVPDRFAGARVFQKPYDTQRWWSISGYCGGETSAGDGTRSALSPITDIDHRWLDVR